jgi:hypothetical protein
LEHQRLASVTRLLHNGALKKTALRRNPAGWLMDGVFRYTLQFEEQRLDKDSGMAGLPGVSERDP